MTTALKGTLSGSLCLLSLAACDRAELYSGDRFDENVQQAYAECSEAEIRFLAAKNGMQTAFENCGSNRFSMFSWSPDGRFLYFQLTTGGHVLNGEDKTIISVPTPPPVSNAVWVRPDLLVIPLGPKDPGEDLQAPEAPEPTPSAADAGTKAPTTPAPRSLYLHSDIDGPTRLVSWDRTAGALSVVAVNLQEPRDLQRWTDEQHVLLSALGEDGARHPYAVNLVTGEVGVAFAFAVGTLENLNYSSEAGLLGWGDGTNTTLYSTTTQAKVAEFPGVLRAIPHPGGRYVALEAVGEAVSPFDQRSGDELTPDARARELERQAEWLKKQPDWVPKELHPPEIQVYDLQSRARHRITYVQGDHFEWYPGRDYYYSVVMWGIEGKQFNRNVALADLFERLRMLDQGEEPLGLTAWTATADGVSPSNGTHPEPMAPPPPPPSAPAGSPSTPSVQPPG